MENRDDLLNILKSYKTMIDRDSGQYPAVVLDDIRKSIEYVLSNIEQPEPKSKNENMIWVCVYCDSTDLYTEDEIMRENLCDLEFPEDIVREWVWLTADPGEIERLSNNENGYDWFDQWYYEEYTADDTDGLYDFAITQYEFQPVRWGVIEQVEVCPHCDSENVYYGWDPDRSGFVVNCKHCGEEIFLCDACMHHEDNPGMKCDWCKLADGGKCFRGRTKLRN